VVVVQPAPVLEPLRLAQFFPFLGGGEKGPLAKTVPKAALRLSLWHPNELRVFFWNQQCADHTPCQVAEFRKGFSVRAPHVGRLECRCSSPPDDLPQGVG
jgi:hypothetical protein